MTKYLHLAGALFCVAAVPAFCAAPITQPAVKPWIVVFKDHAGADRHLAQTPFVVRHTYTILPAIAEQMTDDQAAALRLNPDVKYVATDGVVHVQGFGSDGRRQSPHDASTQVIPYGISMVRATDAWAVTRGAGARVAILDTGIDLDHPDHGVIADSQSFVSGVFTVQDGNGHGTHTSGTVAAADNEIGVVGVAPDAVLLIGKVLDDSGSGYDSDVMAGIDWAVQDGADIISMSLGASSPDPAEEDICDEAEAAGVLVVAAAGNNASSASFYPASYSSVVSVSAIDDTQVIAGFSNYGPLVAVCAPGVDVLSTLPVGRGVVAAAAWNGVSHEARDIEGSADGTVTATVEYCGLGNPGDFPNDIAGKIAHIRRGTLTFADKVANAEAAGVVGVVISNNLPGQFNGTLNTESDMVDIGISQADGDALQAADGTTLTISREPGDYGSESGTSMACPHVAGVAALVVSAALPNRLTPAQVRAVLESTATDLGETGRDDLYGNGLVNAYAAVQSVQTPPPYTMADVVTALQFAGGLATATTADSARFNIAAPGSVDLLEVVRLARKVAGVDANP